MSALWLIFSFEGSNKTIIFDSSITIDSMLKLFLNETHSNPKEKLNFIYKAMVLNNTKNLNKKLSEVFKSNNQTIKVTSPGLIGG